MPTFSLASIKKIYFKDRLKFIELTCLSLFLAFLPSLEGPKNIFLGCYLIVALYRQFQLPSSKWGAWDWIFLSLIVSSFLSALFPFMSGGSEWKGFRGILLWVAFGWTLLRTDYNFDEKKYLFIFAILMTIPPLLWGLTQLMILFTRVTLQLHSVGHVNHSAIYLCMMAGASLAFLSSQFQTLKKKYVFLLTLLSIFLLSAVVISQSRGAFGVVFLLIFALFLLSKLPVKIKTISLSLLAIFLINIIFINPAPVIQKQITNQNNHDILSQRDKVWRASFEVVRLNPLLGIGGGNWKQIKIDQIKSSVESRGETFKESDFALQWDHPHNIYLSNLVDRGILGFITFLSFMTIWLITLINSYKKFNQDSKAMLFVMGSFSAWTTIFGIGFVNTTFHHESALLALFFLGLHLSYLRQKNQLKLFS
ncbi:O-antigen ligase family protein [Candidatus Methylopumilus universalis]|uniref:O-antigen ligase family protein n=1 Tax=Candidatus Methylopumilus universalis TaxID=2588536 RepID=A0ABX5VTP4_9PROT|nr:O-antigen ligase family protein [Candidatus Methylopumilus universalis]QDC51225.1 O-antigen ligase family protein [Candidatus Methylopumilus universalis]QDC61363.1 O-antigen ligase family protein [Candidatus Methylopumilus universalis]